MATYFVAQTHNFLHRQTISCLNKHFLAKTNIFLPVKITLGVDKSGAQGDCQVRPSVLSREHCC